MSNVIPLNTHPLTRAKRAGDVALRLAERLGLTAPAQTRLAADTRALVRSGCSAAWAIRTARRAARRASITPEPTA
jgi:hypothetical protein